MAQKQGFPTHENKLSSRLRIRAWACPSGDCGSLEAKSSGRSGPSAAPSMSQRSRRDFLWAWKGSPELATEACLPTHCLQPPRGHIHQARRRVRISSPNTMPASNLPKQGHTNHLILPVAQSTGPAKPRNLPMRPSPPQRWPEAPLNLGEALHLPQTLPEWGSYLHGYLSPASSSSLPPQIGSYCFSAGLIQTPSLHCQGWTGVPNLEPLHAEFLLLQLATRSADLLLQPPLLLRTHNPELRAGPVTPFARLLGAPGTPGASSRGRGPQSADSAAGGAGRDQAAAP